MSDQKKAIEINIFNEETGEVLESRFPRNIEEAESVIKQLITK